MHTIKLCGITGLSSGLGVWIPHFGVQTRSRDLESGVSKCWKYPLGDYKVWTWSVDLECGLGVQSLHLESIVQIWSSDLGVQICSPDLEFRLGVQTCSIQ